MVNPKSVRSSGCQVPPAILFEWKKCALFRSTDSYKNRNRNYDVSLCFGNASLLVRISISRESVMILTYRAVRWFRTSHCRKLGRVLVARDRLVLGVETDWVTRGYKFRILEFCLAIPSLWLLTTSLYRTMEGISYPRNLSWPTIMSVHTKIECPLERTTWTRAILTSFVVVRQLLHFQWNRGIREGRVMKLETGYMVDIGRVMHFEIQCN